MNAEEEDAYSRMKQFCTADRPDCDYSSWRAQTCKKKRCIEYLHQPTGLTLQSPGAAHLAVLALPTQKQASSCTLNDSKAVSAASCSSDTEAGHVCLIITSLDKLVVQLQRHVSEMQRYDSSQQCSPTNYSNTTQDCSSAGCVQLHPDQSRPVGHAAGRQSDEKGHKTALPVAPSYLCCVRTKAAAQGLLHKWLQAPLLSHPHHRAAGTGLNSAALPLLVEPLLPRSWKRELDQSKLLKGHMETDLYSTAVAQEDIMQGEEEEGLAPSDGFLVADADPLLTPGKAGQVVDALDLIPLYIRQKAELEVSNALAEGLPAVKSCVEQLAARFADKAAHKAWLSSLQEVVRGVEER